jgi:hypothetical protein
VSRKRVRLDSRFPGNDRSTASRGELNPEKLAPECRILKSGERGDRKPFKMALSHQEGFRLITIVFAHPRGVGIRT